MYGCNVNPENTVLLMGLCLLPLLAVSCSWVWALTPQAPITSSHILVLLCKHRGRYISVADQGLAPSLWAREEAVFLAPGWQRQESPMFLISTPFLPRNLTTSWFHFLPQGVTVNFSGLYIYIYFKTLILLFFIYYLLIWERERERERDTVLLFHLLMYSLVDSCMFPDWGLNPQQDDALTNWATWPGFWFIL